MANLKPKKPVLIFFQEIKPGDVAKQQAVSNVATTGGGARDLRIRPAQEFTDILSPMFPKPGTKAGVSQGIVHWFDITSGNLKSAQVELWRPTDARPGEARLGRINAIDAWTVNAAQYQVAVDAGLKWFYLLVMDADGVVWARLLKQENLPNENKNVRDYVNKRIEDTSVSHAVRGTMNFQTKKDYP